ncbi:hypothetical protein AB1Y20_015660 [Prymnesium parvum]|uniref:Major facilitator superfamily (MFS) profile domain-containing protein n=1 Tax=Prymnesium parvum TaxID=97485 RepID=A0AB34JYE8_PRYPA
MAWMAREGSVTLLPREQCGASGDRFLRFLVGVASLGGFLFGYDTGVVSGAMLVITDHFHFDKHEQEMLVSSTLGLAAVGAICSGPANSALGRRMLLIISCVIFTAGAILMAEANSFAVLLTGRMVVGLAIGTASSTVPQYIAELAPPARRGVLVSVNNAAIVIGQVVATLVDGALSGVHDGWRLMLGFGGIPSVAMLLGLLVLPESPRWLVSKGKHDLAKKVLARLRKGQVDAESAVQAEFDEIFASLVTEGVIPAQGDPNRLQAASTTAINGFSWSRIASDAALAVRELWGIRRQLRLGLFLMILQQVIGINTIMYYSADILQQACVAEDKTVIIWLTAPVASGQLVGCLVGMTLIDKYGRRPLVLGSLAGIIAALGLEGAAFGVDLWHCGNTNSTSSCANLSEAHGVCAVTGKLLLFGMIAYLLAFGMGMSAIPWTVNSEIYPLRSRSTCVGIATTMNWLANFVVASTFLDLESAITKPLTFSLYACNALIGFVLLGLYMPETANKKLEDIEKIFRCKTHPSAEPGAH